MTIAKNNQELLKASPIGIMIMHAERSEEFLLLLSHSKRSRYMIEMIKDRINYYVRHPELNNNSVTKTGKLT